MTAGAPKISEAEDGLEPKVQVGFCEARGWGCVRVRPGECFTRGEVHGLEPTGARPSGPRVLWAGRRVPVFNAINCRGCDGPHQEPAGE